MARTYGAGKSPVPSSQRAYEVEWATSSIEPAIGMGNTASSVARIASARSFDPSPAASSPTDHHRWSSTTTWVSSTVHPDPASSRSGRSTARRR